MKTSYFQIKPAIISILQKTKHVVKVTDAMKNMIKRKAFLRFVFQVYTLLVSDKKKRTMQ